MSELAQLKEPQGLRTNGSWLTHGDKDNVILEGFGDCVRVWMGGEIGETVLD